MQMKPMRTELKSNIFSIAIDHHDISVSIRIFDALNQDIFLVRLRQLVWKQLQASNMNGDQFSNHNLNKAVVSILEENGFKDVSSNTGQVTMSNDATCLYIDFTQFGAEYS